VLSNLTGGDPQRLTVTPFDARAQEDGRRIVWQAPAELVLRPAQPLPVAGRMLELTYRTESGQPGTVVLSGDCAGCTRSLALAPGDGPGWQNLQIALGCLAPQRFTGLRLAASQPAIVRLLSARIVPASSAQPCPPPGG
jgi:hypothetical protein